MSRLHRRAGFASAVVLAVSLLSAPAGAALTSSERGQIRDFYARGESVSAPRVRALLARPDLVPAEVAEVLSDAMRRVPFDERHLAFVKNLLFGPATAASRSDLVPPVVSALLARAALLVDSGGDESQRAEELVRIHGFVAGEIASGGKPPPDGHDASRAIRDDALRAAAASYKAHLAQPAFERSRLSPAMLAARAQAEIAVIELLAGLVAPTDLSAWLGLDAAAKSIFEQTGVLVVGLANAPAPKAAAVAAMLEAARPAARATSLLWIGKTRPRGLVARRAVVVAQASLAADRRVSPARLWASAVDPSSPDAALAEVAFVLGRAAAESMIASDAAFADRVDALLRRAQAAGDGGFLAVAPLVQALDRGEGATPPNVPRAAFVGHSVALLLLDAPRAVSLALARAVGGRYEPLEQLALALAVVARDPEGSLRTDVTLGKTADDGSIAAAAVSKVRGRGYEVDGFWIDGHDHVLAWAPSGALSRVERDGKMPTLSTISHARVSTTPGESWTRGSGKDAQVWKRLAGRPEVAFVDDRIVVRAAPASKGRDAIVVSAPAPNVDLALDLAPVRAPGAVVLRASMGSATYAGVSISIEPGEGGRVWLVALDGAGGKVPLAKPAPLPKPGPAGHRVRAKLRADSIEVTVGNQTLKAALPAPLVGGSGDVALSPGDGGELEVRALEIKAAKK